MSPQINVFTVEKRVQNVYKFEEALTLTGFGKYNILVTVLCGFISLGNIFETAGLSFIIPASQCDLNLSLTQKGWLAAIPYIGLVLASQMWGYLADTRGRKKILIISLFCGSICSMISSLSPNLIVFTITRLISSSMMAASNAIVHAYFGELMPKTHIDMMISVLSSVIIGSTIVSTGLSWIILTLIFDIPLDILGFSYKPWRLLTFIFAIPFLLCSIALVKAPESPKYLMSLNKNDEVLDLLRGMYAMNNGKDVATYPVDAIVLDDQDRIKTSSKNASSLQVIWNQTVPIFKPPLLKFTMILFICAFGLYSSANGTFMWLPDIVDRFYTALNTNQTDGKTFCETLAVRSSNQQILLIDNDNSTLTCDDSLNTSTYPAILVLTFIMTVLNIIVVVLLKWISKNAIFLITMFASAVSAVALYFVTNYILYWILIFIYLSTSVLVGVISAFAVELFPTQYRAMAVSTILLFGRVGSIVGTNVTGLLIETNCDLNFFLFFALFIVCCISGYYLPNNSRKQSEETTRL